ncbi:MAG: LTA synthase family protein [Planctomycetes bacterium]|nr:LTA synthase family protein [Planctomycetota bacterium]
MIPDAADARGWRSATRILLVPGLCAVALAVQQTWLCSLITGGGSEFPLTMLYQVGWTALILLALLIALLRRPAWLWTLVGLTLLFQFIVVGYWVYTGRPLPPSLLLLHAGEAQQGVGLAGIEWDWRALIPLCVLPPAFLGWRALYRHRDSLPIRRRTLIGAAAIPLIGLLVIGHLQHVAIWINAQSTARSVRGLGVCGWWMQLAITNLRMGDVKLIPIAKTLATPEPGIRRKIVVIQWESLDAGIPGYTCGADLVAPNLTRLAAHAWRAPRIRAEHLAGASSDADCAFTLAIPAQAEWPALQSRRFDPSVGIGHSFRSRNLRAVAYHNNVGTFFERGDIYPTLGFERFADMAALGLSREIWGAPDHKLFPAIRADWDQHGQPDLSFVITLSGHHPFTMPRRYGVQLPEFPQATSDHERAYLQSIWYTDQAIGAFIDAIDLSTTWVMIYGDHPPGIPQDRRDRDPNRLPGRYLDATEVTANGLREFVPLIIVGPRQQAGDPMPWSIDGHLDLKAACLALALGE